MNGGIEILQLLNNVILNIVTLIEMYAPVIFAFSLLFFTAWLIYQIGVLIHDLIIIN
jgi:hypothetical protein